ncbi:MAG: MEDS domain-containing protein [Spirochaetia bacterium]|nr:MEDS domain-containing protein [Spirochaetia bacterium]
MSCGKRAACFSNDITWELLEHYLEGDKISLKELERSTALLLQRTSDVYYKDERFDPDRMLALLSEFYQGADEKGFHGARVIGEMTADIGRIEGGERLLEYESRVSMLLREKPITTVCQYNAAEFDGAMIMDVLKVHPMMVVRGSVIHNPFFIPPEEFLSQHNLVE